MFFPLPVPEELHISFLQLSFIIRFDCEKKKKRKTQPNVKL